MFEIVKVTIKGELPKSCLDCWRKNYYEDDYHTCGVMANREIKDIFHRPDWCPLELESEE